MASFVLSEKKVCFSVQNQIYSYNLRPSGECTAQVLTCEKPTADPDKATAIDGNDRILVCGLSPCGYYLVACDDYKQIWVWKTTEEQGQWILQYSRDLARRAISLAFTSCGSSVLVADKSGDVVCYSLVNDNEGQVLVGHVSMLLDVILCGVNDSYVITADRDEKIRVSHYPNAYSIQAFCLGHTDFVSSLSCFEKEQLLISGSGDGTVKLWNYVNGNQLASLDFTSEFQTPSTDQSDCKDSADPETGSEVKVDGDGIMSRTKGLADVKCLACCQKNKYAALSFDKRNKVILLKLSKNQDGRPELTRKQTINCPGGDIWAVQFDSCGVLWIMGPDDAGAHVKTYAYNDVTEQYDVITSSCDERNTLDIVNNINKQNAHILKDVTSQSSGFETLHKVRIDNMKEYKERKQVRLEQKAQKRAPSSRDATHDVTDTADKNGSGEEAQCKLIKTS